MMWYFLSTHKDPVKKTNKIYKKNGTKDMKKENLRTPITHHQDMKQSVSVVIMNNEKTWSFPVAH
jgi:hypothetical protein